MQLKNKMASKCWNVFGMAVLGMAAVAPAQAQVYRCEVAGKVEYQQQPCTAGSTSGAKLSIAASEKPDIYTTLTAGMSLAQVQQAVPQAKTGKNDTLKNGARELLRVDSINVAGQSFDAKFFFIDGKFHRVNFSGAMNTSNEENTRVFEKLSEIFRARYGKPTHHKLSNERMGLVGRADWDIGKGEVWIITVPVTGSTSFVAFGFLPN